MGLAIMLGKTDEHSIHIMNTAHHIEVLPFLYLPLVLLIWTKLGACGRGYSRHVILVSKHPTHINA